jgi:glycosyltransferase involved in cell wall biosynthesis
MNKPLFIISSPFDVYSGYSARSRDLIKAIIELDKYNVKLISQRWGDCAWGFCKDNPEWSFLYKYVLTTPQLPQQPEIWMQITVPNEFMPIGKYNIGVTAGIESNICAADLIEGANRMNLTLISSEHSKQVFQNSKFEKRNKQTNQVEGIIELNKPVEVLFEGANLDIYLPQEPAIKGASILSDTISDIKEDFAYLFVGHWMNGDLGEDRKNVSLLIKSFFETFKNKSKQPALILKTSGAVSSYVDREIILNKIQQIKNTVDSKNLPNVYLLHGEFTDTEINEIYNHPKVKAMVSLTKGEGFGRPLLEFSLVKKPIIVSNWSGHMDFLNPEFVVAINGELKNVHPSAANQFLIPESQWFSPYYNEIGNALKDVFENYKNYTEGAKRQAYKSKNEFSWDKMKDKVDSLLTQYIPEFPKAIELKLPQLKKIELPKLKKTETNG